MKKEKKARRENLLPAENHYAENCKNFAGILCGCDSYFHHTRAFLGR